MDTRLVMGPTSEIITVAEAKKHLNIGDDTSDDVLIARLIGAARHVAQDLTGRTVAACRWAVSDLAWPRGREIVLSKPPFAALVSFTYLDAAGMSQTIPESLYYTATVDRFGRVLLRDGESWPGLRMRAPGWTVTYDAGYSESGELPVELREAMYQLIGHWYAHREGIVVGESGMRVAEMPLGVRELLHLVDVR